MKSNIFSIFVLGACILFFTGCTVDNIYSRRYEFRLKAQESDTIFISQIADSITYLNLDTAGTNCIRHYSDMVMTSHNIFILDNQQKCIWNFDSNGKYKRCLSCRGHGTGEYINLWQCEYDSQKQELLVLDGKSILHYDNNFNFIYRENLDIYATDFKLIGGYYFLSFLGGDSDGCGVFLFDRNERTSKKIISKEENVCWNDNWEMVSWGDTIAVAAPPLRNTIFHFSGITPVDTIEICTPRSKRVYLLTDDPFLFEDYIRDRFMESTTWLYMAFWKHKEKMQHVMLNKRTNQLFEGSIIFNDIDFVEKKYNLSYSEGNTFSFIVEKEIDKGMAIQFIHLKY